YRLPQPIGHQRKMVVLNPYHRLAISPSYLVQHGIRKALVHVAIAHPVVVPHHYVLDEHVTRGPQHAVGESQVVALAVGVIEPYTAKRVALLIFRNENATVRVGRFAVCRSGTPRHPGAVGTTHGGVQRRDQPARRLPHGHTTRAPRVLVRLAVRQHDQGAIPQQIIHSHASVLHLGRLSPLSPRLPLATLDPAAAAP